VFDSYRYGEMPTGHLSPLIAVQSLHDSTRAPAGKASMYLYHFAPLELARGGVQGWDEVKELWCNAVYDEMCRYTTNLDRNSILGAIRETPLDHHRHSASMKHGDIFGIGSAIASSWAQADPGAGAMVPGSQGLSRAVSAPGGAVTLGGRATAMNVHGLENRPEKGLQVDLNRLRELHE
jgi:phytoene dehydrogenase-like protein